MSAIIEAHEAKLRERWTFAVMERLSQGPALTTELIDAIGATGWREKTNASRFLRSIPGIRTTGEKRLGPTGHQNHVWEIAP